MKWQFIGKVLGTPHPTGYPLFIIISAIFSWAPLPIPLFARVNLISVFFAILTLIFLYRTLRLLKLNIFLSAITTMIFAYGKIFWSQATEAEVYTLNSFFIILIIYSLIKWKDERNERYLNLSVFFAIFSLSNHITIFLLFPSIFIFILLVSPKSLLKKEVHLSSTFALLILFSLYLFLVWRSNIAIYSEFEIKNINDFIYFVSGGIWKKSLKFSLMNALEEGLERFAITIQSNLTFSSLLIIPFGLLRLLKDLKTFLLLFLSFFLYLLFSCFYSIRDVEVNYIPIYLMATIIMGEGMNFLLGLRISKSLKAVSQFAFLIIPIFLFLSNYGELKIKESYWGKWLKVVFSNFKRDKIFIPDYINYDQDMALCYAVFGLEYIKQNNFVLGEHFFNREKIIEDYLEGKEISFRGYKLPKGLKIICFDKEIATKLSEKFDVEKSVIMEEIRIEFFRIKEKSKEPTFKEL